MNVVTAALLDSPAPALAARQRQRPLIPIRGMVSVLDRNENAVLRLIDEGELRWAWNVALQPDRAWKKALRVLPQCVDDYRAGRKCDLAWAEVQRLLLAGGEKTVQSIEVVRLLNVCQSHVAALLRREELLLCRKGRHGRGGTALIWSYSFTNFLKRRCYPVPMAEN